MDLEHFSHMLQLFSRQITKKSSALCVLPINKYIKIYKVQEKFILMNRTTNKTKPTNNRSKKKKNPTQEKKSRCIHTHTIIQNSYYMLSDVSWKKNECICIVLLSFDHSGFFLLLCYISDGISKHTITQQSPKKKTIVLN